MPCTQSELEKARRYRRRHKGRVNAAMRARAAAGLTRQPTAAQKRASEKRHPETRREKDRRGRARVAADHERVERRRAAVRARYAANPAMRESAKDGAAARRARKRAVLVERVFRSVVWQRDSGLCGICGTAADPADWHLDHVIALSRGGEHSYANTQVAHPACNMTKGAG